jgi:two-component system OmpR family response regulator
VRVLVIEDEEAIARALQRGLRAEGFAVDIAKDGNEGLWMARERHYDAIVLDILLPGMNGFRICKTLREESIWTPILMLTAKEGELDEAEALDTGADDYLTKPFSFVVLVAHLRALIRRGARVRPRVLRAGDLALDPASHRFWKRDTEISLTPREFSIMELLISRAGEAIGKREIMDHVWEDDFEGDSNIVEVYIGYLRRKIDVPFGDRSIETVRGVGYRLRAQGD